MITVYNKADLLNQPTLDSSVSDTDLNREDGLYISCETQQGLGQLVDVIQEKLMVASDRVVCEYRVLQGGELYQMLAGGMHCTIEAMLVDEHDPQFIRLEMSLLPSSLREISSSICRSIEVSITNESLDLSRDVQRGIKKEREFVHAHRMTLEQTSTVDPVVVGCLIISEKNLPRHLLFPSCSVSSLKKVRCQIREKRRVIYFG